LAENAGTSAVSTANRETAMEVLANTMMGRKGRGEKSGNLRKTQRRNQKKKHANSRMPEIAAVVFASMPVPFGTG
jgi:hypothetical protein